MKYVLETLHLEEEKEKLPVIKLEIDYELMTLFDALEENDKVGIIKAKEKLNHLRHQLLEIQNK
ncbi:hypothetical protein ACFFIS_12055 [Virgibacillus soli]|uniref:Antirepressor AbbA n=1 Tax=Paracerasibacillus soli TaxID=480284 RepID=A0ABU5CNX8_9BACI|nr:hypothetical protein [Virgibacillus soli]MDY0408062.1 hypothetical protein [Virgibacillus soli]